MSTSTILSVRLTSVRKRIDQPDDGDRPAQYLPSYHDALVSDLSGLY
ncbi:hypothetical protein [Natronocalculus amylovorans]|uniref:Uncharacterized protein n=1 Tax=Natronocalculus amylovorans TaxID=2917812 RepID=A0AAE3FZ07_9EURY|nr:hypothetical protein [Natronocalculus amylovorans]MCL9817505.1 hypothetical protein [Natronocalculus amylovorans]